MPVIIAFNPAAGAKKGPVSGSLTITGDDATNPSATVTLSAIVK
jgi:hypothetical protein